MPVNGKRCMNSTGSHFPVTFQDECKNGNKSQFMDARQRCKICSKKTRIMCQQCGVFLHINDAHEGRDCWGDFHSLKSFK